MSAFEDYRKINIGCGYDRKPGYLNVDMDPHCAPDLLITHNDFSQLPRKRFDELYANDVLEHIKRAETLPALLEWADLMTMGATLELQTSSILAIADLMRAETSYAAHAGWTICMFGNQCHDGDYHHTGFTEQTLRVQLSAAGFEIDQLKLRGRWMFWIKGRKTADWTALLETGRDYGNAEFVNAVYGEALYRAPEPVYLDLLVDWLETGTASRRDILKKLFSSEERGLCVATRLGL